MGRESQRDCWALMVWSVNANCSDPRSFGESPFGPCWGDGWETESSGSWETSLRGADRRLSFCFFATGTNGGTWPLKLHLFEHLAHCGSAVSSLANPPPNTAWDIFFFSLFLFLCLPWFWKWKVAPSLISGAALKQLICLFCFFCELAEVRFHAPEGTFSVFSFFILFRRFPDARFRPPWSLHKGLRITK